MHKPFTYDFKIRNTNYNGTIVTVTGQFAGGERSTVESYRDGRGNSVPSTCKTRIRVIRSDGSSHKIKADHYVGLPPETLITTFYQETDIEYIPFCIYVHDSKEIHGLGGDAFNDAIKRMSGRGFLRRFFGVFMDMAFVLLSVGIGIVAFLLARQELSVMVSGIIGFISFYVFCHFSSSISTIFGGWSLIRGKLNENINNVCRVRACEIQDEFERPRTEIRHGTYSQNIS